MEHDTEQVRLCQDPRRFSLFAPESAVLTLYIYEEKQKMAAEKLMIFPPEKNAVFFVSSFNLLKFVL